MKNELTQQLEKLSYPISKETLIKRFGHEECKGPEWGAIGNETLPLEKYLKKLPQTEFKSAEEVISAVKKAGFQKTEAR